jgi:23S rRNA (adenine2503-C2)-methyltransferase
VTGPRSLYDLTGPELAALAAEAGEPAYRGRQLVHWLDRRRVVDPLAMTDLPAGFRERLAERFTGSGLTLDRHQTGDGGWTHKFLFRLAGGDSVESVLMFYPAAGRGVPTESDEQDHDWEGGRVGRATVCISTQAGCAMGCSFCATGQFGFTRNLSTGEVVEQVARVWAMLPELRPRADAPDHLTNVVFMGMGEPFANQTATWAAAWRLHQGLGLSARAVTISTVGLVPGIRRAAAEPLAVNLAVSIHAPDDELRSRLVPVNRTWPIAELLAAVGDYVRATRRRVSFEYALMHGVNDDPEQGRRLGRLLAPLRVPGSGGHAAHVNLIPYNPTPGSGFAPPSRTAARRFRDAVASTGVPVSIRATRGVGIDAACGQLRTTAGRPGRTVLPLVAAGGSGGLKERSGSPPGIRGSDRSEEGSGGREVGRSRAPDGLRNDEAAPGDGGATREAGAPGGGGPPTVSVKGRPV